MRALAVTGVLLLVGTAAVAQQAAPATPAATPGMTQAADHRIVMPQTIQWTTAPPSVPRGVQISVLYGDPTKAEPFAMRLRFPANTTLAPHTHPVTEMVTVISGTFRLGTGQTADRNKVQDLPAGSFFAFAPGMAHFAYTDVETIVQVSTTGPWALNYVNPNDDPSRAR